MNIVKVLRNGIPEVHYVAESATEAKHLKCAFDQETASRPHAKKFVEYRHASLIFCLQKERNPYGKQLTQNNLN